MLHAGLVTPRRITAPAPSLGRRTGRSPGPKPPLPKQGTGWAWHGVLVGALRGTGPKAARGQRRVAFYRKAKLCVLVVKHKLLNLNIF